jgi:hypothetical protein
MSLEAVIGGEMKASESDPGSNSDSDLDKGKHIIDAEPSATVATTKVQPNEPEESEEGEHLFHSQMWVKGAPLHFIVDSRSQKNLISVEVIKWLEFSTTPHPQPYNMGGSAKDEISMSTNSVSYPMASSPSRMRYCVMFPHLNFVMFF